MIPENGPSFPTGLFERVTIQPGRNLSDYQLSVEEKYGGFHKCGYPEMVGL